MKAAIIVASDKGSRGERLDESGKVIEKRLTDAGYQVVKTVIIADERELLKEAMIRFCDEVGVSLLMTTGGTGFSKRDVTPEATLEVIERRTPGVPEAMRAYSLKITPRAMLTRAEAGIRGQTLIVNLPGSPKAVSECLDWILEPLAHGLDILLGETSECAR